MSYEPGVYREQGGGKLVVAATGEIDVKTGGKVLADGTQASLIADPSGGATQDAEARTAIVAIIDALIGAGIVAAS